MDEFISANPCSFDHASLFEMVQRLTLDHRLSDTFCCLVSVCLPIVTSSHDTLKALGCSCWLICSNAVHIYICVMQGWFSPGQVFVLDEYCARNGVRGCHRHLCYLRDLLERAENGAIIDPTLLHYSFAFCASHVHGNRCDLIPSLKIFLLRKLLCLTGFEAH